MASTPDYAILSAPRISAAGFAVVLAAAHSPAMAEADAEYSAFVAAGVDPAVGLAMFRKESSFGTAGRAVTNRSWGNIRGGSAYPTDSGAFRIYPSWTVGATDCARLLAVYGRNQIRTGVKTDTVQTLPYVWAPAADGNVPDAYGDQLAAWVGEYAATYPSGAPTSDQVAPGTNYIYQARLAATTALYRLTEPGYVCPMVVGLNVPAGPYLNVSKRSVCGATWWWIIGGPYGGYAIRYGDFNAKISQYPTG